MSVFVLLLSFGVAIPVIINQSYKSNSGYITLWDAADVLSYYGSFSGAVGTIILGIIAWQQNKRLLKIEENSFLASNACMGFIQGISISGIQQRVCNLDSHYEQIVSTLENGQGQKDYASYSIEVDMQMKDNMAALVKINSIDLSVSQDGEMNQILLDFNSIDTKFSRVAISYEGIKFNVTMLVNSIEKERFLELANSLYSQISIDIDFTLLTDKYVSTHLKCRSFLICCNYSENERMYSKFKIDDNNPPMCFWYGNDMLDKNLIEIKQANA
ncbi:MAG TPA: hypothetical protein GX707_08895 [Epulopiscium sp.]|nr:hypothetical protein [Candidatus Epulonipiscium sp.]